MPRNEFWLCFILSLEVCLSFSFCTEIFTYLLWVAPKRKSKWAGGLLRFMCIQTHPVWISDEPHLIIKIIRVKFRRKKWFFFSNILWLFTILIFYILRVILYRFLCERKKWLVWNSNFKKCFHFVMITRSFFKNNGGRQSGLN